MNGNINANCSTLAAVLWFDFDGGWGKFRAKKLDFIFLEAQLFKIENMPRSLLRTLHRAISFQCKAFQCKDKQREGGIPSGTKTPHHRRICAGRLWAIPV